MNENSAYMNLNNVFNRLLENFVYKELTNKRNQNIQSFYAKDMSMFKSMFIDNPLKKKIIIITMKLRYLLKTIIISKRKLYPKHWNSFLRIIILNMNVKN